MAREPLSELIGAHHFSSVCRICGIVSAAPELGTKVDDGIPFGAEDTGAP